MRTPFWMAALALALATSALATPASFDFKDPKGVNTVTFKLDAPLEKISGTANGVSGAVTFDPKNPAATKGKIIVATSSLVVPNGMQTKIMLGNQWLNAEKFPEISFEAKEVKNVKTEGEKTKADVTGTFTLKGISKEMTVPVEFNFLADKLSDRVPNQKGDLLVLRATFAIKRADFDIMPGKSEDKVAAVINLEMGIAGAAAK